ncbi:MAG: serine/threonine protein kinase [Phycisphaeraceae bacterium]|nr:serine/threonine protein kinase [Phycisphaeraceae bacterium]
MSTHHDSSGKGSSGADAAGRPKTPASDTTEMEASRISAPDSTRSGEGTNSGGSTGMVVPTADEVRQEVAKQGSNIDTILGRMVIDNQLATPEEVQHCLTMAKTLAEERNQRSLAELLIENDYVTMRQMSRLREMANAEKSGQKIPGYKIISKLGAGAMATVFKAKQLSLDRIVAIKVLPRKFTSNPQFIERFYAEGRAAAQLNHPNIVQAYDVGKAGDYHYFVMEYVEGSTVYDEIVKNRRYTESEAINIAIQVAEALHHAHERGLIHRDVKPKNIMITGSGIAKLADMGLARAISDKEAAEAEQGKAFGTPYYISPEQIRGDLNITPAADIYSLGATLYHMVTGAVPFDGKNPSAVMHKHLKADLVAPDHVNPRLSSGISEVIEMMMSKNPKARYRSCQDVISDLIAIRGGKAPPIAHKDFGAADLAQIVQAEAAASAEGDIPVSQTAPAAGLSNWLVITLGILLIVSVMFNIFLLVGGSSGS